MLKFDRILGVDNDGLFSFGHYTNTPAIEKKNYGGYCSSAKCTGGKKADRNKNPNYKYMIYNDLRILKTTNKNQTSCPDCSHALFWDEITQDNQPTKPKARKVR